MVTLRVTAQISKSQMECDKLSRLTFSLLNTYVLLPLSFFLDLYLIRLEAMKMGFF